MISSCTVLGLVGIKVKFHVSSTFRVSTSLGSMFLGVSSFHMERGLFPLKTTLEMCIRPLSVSFRELEIWLFCNIEELWFKLLPIP